MRRRSAFLSIRPALLAPAVLCLILAAPALAEFDQERSFQTDNLTVRNLIGEVRVTGHGGSGYDVLVRVRGKDASPDLVQIQTDEGANPVLTVVFPLKQERDYVYPAMGKKSKSTFTVDKGSDSWLSSLMGSLSGRKITVRGSGSGLEVWADVEIRVPTGGSLQVKHGVGEITAEGVNGDLRLDNSSGAVDVSGITGDLVTDTGSGHVTVRDVTGEVRVDTGSGMVELEHSRGDLIEIDTGSGHVTVVDVETPKLHVDTGSGHVRASAVRADSALIDTGSGMVELELDRMGAGEYSIDTGSGGVTLALPVGASAEVRAETGSGTIEMNLGEPVELYHKSKDEMRFRVGDGAAEVEIDTGSGSIRITRAG